MTTRQTTPDILGDLLSADVSRETPRGVLAWVPIGRVYDNPYQTRQAYDADHIQRLADNIWALREELPETCGLQQPPVARVVEFTAAGDTQVVPREAYAGGQMLRRVLFDKTAVELHFGHNRLRAWRLLRNQDSDAYAEFPVFLAHATDEAMWRHAVSENSQRKDITPIEEALTLRRAIKAFGLTQEAAGAPFGYARTTVSNKLRLLELPDPLQALLADGRLSERHGRELLRLAAAPHMYNLFDTSLLAAMSVRELEIAITSQIARCKPVSKTRTGYLVKAAWVDQTMKETFEPPVWPLDWEPAVRNEAIVGPCTGCRYLVTFGGDAGPRCTQGLATCFEAKNRRWNREQSEAQQAALLQQAAPPAPPSAPPLVEDDEVPVDEFEPRTRPLPDWAPLRDVEIEDDDAEEDDDDDEAGEDPPPPVQLPATVVAAPVTDIREADVTWFSTRWSTYQAPAALLERGLCTQARCSCLVLGYCANPQDHYVRPSPDAAPNMCYGCTSKQRMALRRQELEHGDVQAMRKRVKAEQEEAERLLRAAFYSYTASELWNNAELLRDLIVYSYQIHQSYEARHWDITQLQESLFLGIAAKQCMTWNNSKELWHLGRVQEWLARIAGGAGRVAAPVPDAPLVAPEPDAPAPRPAPAAGWEAEWNDEDEAIYQNVIDAWDGNWRHLPVASAGILFPDVTARCLLRLAEACPDQAVAADLRRFHAQRAQKEQL